MKDISKLDVNFKVETNINKTDVEFFNVRSAPFQVCGLMYEKGKFRRMPEAVAKEVNDGVYGLHTHTAGGRLRFKTDSAYVAIHAKMSNISKMAHMAFSGSIGFDLYVKKDYVGTFMPTTAIEDGYENIIEFGTNELREITINFPLYSGVDELFVGLQKGCKVLAPKPFKIEKPIVYYGSSITQGGCASRPGTCYQGFVSRAIDADYVNLGFSGSARAEKVISDYVNGLDMSVFVYDYDHNAPSLEHLMQTHERMFLEIREKHKDLPIIIMSRPKYCLTDVEKARFETIKKTYENAVARGDKNVYLIDGATLMKVAKRNGTVDNCHPTDLGFYSMAQPIIKVLKQIL